MASLGLSGLIHIWGNAGSGKTLFAVALASDISKTARIEWVNTDGKKSFVKYLKQNITASEGRVENVTISMINEQNELLEFIRDLSNSELPELLVIDPVTRVLDLGRMNPTLWGRELVEDVLPTLAGLVHRKNLSIIITSECRMLDDSMNHAIHHKTIAKWIDHDLYLSRDLTSTRTHIFRKDKKKEQETAQLQVTPSGILEIIPLIHNRRIAQEA